MMKTVIPYRLLRPSRGITTSPRRAPMSTRAVPLVISPSEYDRLPRESVVPIDVSWFMPTVPRKGSEEFKTKRIPTARFLDVDQVASKHELNLPHMMPSKSIFASACESLGIKPDSHVVFYDSAGVFSSPRALFMFKAFGHAKASVLNGGLPLWEIEKRPIETGEPAPIKPTTYNEPALNELALRTYEDMAANAKRSLDNDPAAELVLDARPAPRYNGSAPEPRPGLSSGHMPHAISLPFSLLLSTTKAGDISYTTMRPASELRGIFTDRLGYQRAAEILDAKASRKIVTTCGSGMTAAVIWLALQQIGLSSSLYDESWMGYAARPESIIVKGD